MNHSFYSADRTTHSKVVVIALICATTVAGIGIAAHSRGVDILREAAHPGAGRPAVMASAVQVALR